MQLLARIRATSVEPFHLFPYLDEETFRFNTRKADDAGRLSGVAASVVGKRLTYAQLKAPNRAERREGTGNMEQQSKSPPETETTETEFERFAALAKHIVAVPKSVTGSDNTRERRNPS